MPARPKITKVINLTIAAVLVALLLTTTWSTWQYRQFWQDCQHLPQGSATQSWHQGVHMSFGFPKDWQGGQCRTDGSQESVRLTSRTSFLWRHHQPLGASNLVITSQDRGEQTLPKTLADLRRQSFDGQRTFDTVRVDGYDGLVVVDRPTDSLNQTTTVYIDQDDRRYQFVWTIRAWTDRQFQHLERPGSSGSTYLEQLFATVRFN